MDTLFRNFQISGGIIPVTGIDMLTSKLNKQRPKYASGMPDPESYITVCMSITS